MSESLNSESGGIVNKLSIEANASLRPQHKKPGVELKHPGCKNWLIHLHYVRREFKTCKQIIQEELIRLNGNSEYANYILALILRSEGKLAESLEKLQVCHELEPTNSNTVKQIARSLFLLGRHKLAIEAYGQSLQLHEDPDGESHFNMGMSFLYLKDLDKAQHHMNLSLHTNTNVEAFEVLAQIALARNNLPDAIAVYEKAIKVFPENTNILSNLGVLYMKVGKDEIAFNRLSSALSFDSSNSKALVATASMMQTYEDYDFALAKYKIAMRNIPDSASLWNNIGMCFFGKKKFVAAISCLKRASYLSAFDWKIQHNLGLVHLHMQQYASAFQFLTAAINLKPDESHNFALLAIAISHLDDIEHAKEAYDEAMKLNAASQTTNRIILLVNFSTSLIKVGNHAEAYDKLLEANKILLDPATRHSTIDEETKETFQKTKGILKSLHYKFPEKANSSGKFTTQASLDQASIRNLEKDLV